jgi:hypothetical protein
MFLAKHPERVQCGKSSLGIRMTADERLHACESCVLQVDESGPIWAKVSLIERAQGVAKKIV